jgi:hypothetical protein
MKFDKQFAAFLYEYKYLPLQGIGEVRLDDNFQLPPDAEKNIFYPADGISFTYNKKQEITDELKAYLKSKITKPITLIVSDLEEEILQINNWLNIGKAYTIEGVGTLTKLQTGVIEFSSGVNKAEKISAIVAAVANKESDYKTQSPKNNNKRVLIIGVAAFVVLAILAGIVWAIISFMQGSSKNKMVENSLPITDTVAKKQTSAPTDSLLAKNDTVRYKMYFFRTKYRSYAFEKLNSFEKSDQINMDSAMITDTLRYRLFIYKKVKPSDTVAVKKLLESYFKHEIKVEASK